jgi:hypothetical protein
MVDVVNSLDHEEAKTCGIIIDMKFSLIKINRYYYNYCP